ncbi:hypothetical protein FGB62_48g077 [Gracilaria domingensis]|nr:hypothetical protein FGB62_48g077 [Gracilaria domingensis]
MDNDAKESSRMSSDEENHLRRPSTDDKRSRCSLADTDSPRGQGETGMHQRAATEESSDHRRSLLTVRSRRLRAAQVQGGDKAGDMDQRRQSSPKSSSTRKGILPRITQLSRPPQKAGTSRYPHQSDTTSRIKSNTHFSRSRSSHEALSHENREGKQISRSSSERVRRQALQNSIHDTARHHGRKIAKSRTWNEDTHRPTMRDDTEGELDGFFRFAGSISRASWRLLTSIPDALSQLSEGTVRLLERILPCFGPPANLLADE